MTRTETSAYPKEKETTRNEITKQANDEIIK